MVLAFAVTQELDILLLGEDRADSLGMPVEKMRFAIADSFELVATLSQSSAANYWITPQKPTPSNDSLDPYSVNVNLNEGVSDECPPDSRVQF